MTRPRTLVALLLGLFLTSSLVAADLPAAHKIEGVPRFKQLTNYCGPAVMASVFRAYGKDLTQEKIGRAIYDAVSGATHGGDMLFYAREQGFAAYSWNASVADMKRMLAADLPVIVLQQNSEKDSSGHYRVLTGYDDKNAEFCVVDPYYDNITEQTYAECDKWWSKWGHWALLIVPKEKDCYQNELDERNAVVHMDLGFAKYKRKDYAGAMAEAKLALTLEPRSQYTVNLVEKIQRATGAGAR